MRNSNLCGLLLLACSFGCLFSNAQVTGLSFRPVDAKYSLALDRIILISASPNQLHIYNPVAQADQIVALPEAPLNVSVSPDGLHAAVAYSDGVAYADLQAGSIAKTFPNIPVGTSTVILGSGYIYVPGISSINIATGQLSSSLGFLNRQGVFDALDNSVYSADELINRFDASAGVLTTSPYFEYFDICGPLTLSTDGTVIYDACGTVFSASPDASKDMRYLGVLQGQNIFQTMVAAGSLKQVAAIPLVTNTYTATGSLADTVVDLFDSSSFNQVGQLATTPFAVNSTSYAAHGRWVFYNSTSSMLFLITQADSTAALTHDFALEVVNLTNANSCNANFASSTASAAAPGGYATAQISSGEDCVFTAASSVPWIVLSAGYYGSGNTTLTYLVRPNLTAAPRSGTITLGSQTFTVTQNAAAAPADLNPLSFTPVAADYDKALDKVVMVSSSPNELHVYDPISQSDQIVPLGFTPLSVSVRPDGLFAAVGHHGNLSYVDLQGLSVAKVIPVDMDIAGIALAANGYAYCFPSQLGALATIDSVQISTGVISRQFANGDANIPRLNVTGDSLYVGGVDYDFKMSIGGGPAPPLNGPSGNFGGYLWLSEDGNRLVTSSGYTYSTSAVSSQDLLPQGRLSGAGSVGWAADSLIRRQTAVLLGDSDPSNGTAINTQLQIYAENGLQLQSQQAMPSFTVGSNSYVSHGRYVFWNAAATKLFVFTEADSTSGLLSDYAEYTVEAPGSLPACTYAVTPSMLYIGPLSTSSSLPVNVASNCSWIAEFPSPTWLNVINGSPATGNETLYFMAGSNAGSARTESVAIGDQIFTVVQAASTCAYTLSSSSQTISQAGGTGSFTLTTGSGCGWSIQSNAAWLTVTSGQSGTGSATIQYAVLANTTTSFQIGSLIVAGDVYFTVTEQPVPPPPTPLNFVPVTPCRVLDTRLASGGPFVFGKTIRTVLVPISPCGIPFAASAYSLNVTVVPHGVLNYLTVWPTGQAQPYVSTLNSDGRVKANAAIVPAGTNGAVSFYVTDDTDLVLDINGYFLPASLGSGLAFYPITPCRISDTRNAVGLFGGPALTGGQARDIPVSQSACGVPSSAQAYSLNFTAVPPGQIGYLSTWPTGQSTPYVSTLNAPAGVVTANAAIVPAGTGGDIETYSSDNTDLVIDISGYFAPVTRSGLHFYTTVPCRVLDTRSSGNGLPFNGTLQVSIAGSCGVPSTAAAAVLNATVVPQGSLSFLALWPSGTSMPLVSTLNSESGVVTSNMAIVPMAGGSISAFATNPTHLILDVSGYFAP